MTGGQMTEDGGRTNQAGTACRPHLPKDEDETEHDDEEEFQPLMGADSR